MHDGLWMIETANATYTFDMTARTVTRDPMSGDLRRDGEPIGFTDLAEVEVGRPMEMMLNLRADGIQTYRCTSPVLRVGKR